MNSDLKVASSICLSRESQPVDTSHSFPIVGKSRVPSSSQRQSVILERECSFMIPAGSSAELAGAWVTLSCCEHTSVPQPVDTLPSLSLRIHFRPSACGHTFHFQLPNLSQLLQNGREAGLQSQLNFTSREYPGWFDFLSTETFFFISNIVISFLFVK